MKNMFHGTIGEKGSKICFGATYTDDNSEIWHFKYDDTDEYIEITAEELIERDGKVDRQPKFSDLPLAIAPEQLTDDFLEISENDSKDRKHLKEGLRMFRDTFPETLHPIELQNDLDNNGWSIQIARYFGYNESTLALLKAPDGQHYMVRSAGYPYGKPEYDRSVLNWKYMNPKNGRLHWDDYLNDISKGKDNIEAMAHELKALSFIPCLTSNPREEFEERAEIERFMTREEIAENHFTSDLSTTQLLKKFTRVITGRKRALLTDEFNNVDVNREKWYSAERLPKDFRDTFISKDEAMDLVKQVCEDFGVPNVRKVRFCYPAKPSFWKRKREPSRVDGTYTPTTRDISIKFHPDKDGFSKHTLLHELAHHLNEYFVHGGEKPSAAHGTRFKRIHMHLMHNYDDIPVEDILNSSAIRMAYGRIFPLTEDDILKRDFTERRTFDVLPIPAKKREYDRLIARFGEAGFSHRIIPPYEDFEPVYIECSDGCGKIPFRDFNPMDVA